MLVSRNVNSNLVQGLAVVLERYIAAYAISDFVGKEKEFNKYYNYKMKGGKIYQESDSNWFDLDPLTKSILENQETLQEAGPIGKTDYDDPKSTEQKEKKKPISKTEKWGKVIVDVDKAIKDLRQNKEPGKNEKVEKPKGFSSASISQASLNLEPTWVEVSTGGKSGQKSQLGIKVVPMMIEGFNIKHTISVDMQRYILGTFLAKISRGIMRRIYKLIDRWTMFGNRPRGDIRQDVFYARTGHDGQPFILLEKNEDIPKLFFAQPQNMLKLWKMSWGNLLIADDVQKVVMFCMKKYKGMCSNFSYSMIFAQTKEMAKVFEDMEDARKATGSLFRFNKKISSLGGK